MFLGEAEWNRFPFTDLNYLFFLPHLGPHYLLFLLEVKLIQETLLADSIALRILTAHNYFVISAHTRARTYTTLCDFFEAELDRGMNGCFRQYVDPHFLIQ